MGITDILNTARDAMAAQTFGLTVTGQNVANVNTPGYVRRQARSAGGALPTEIQGERGWGCRRRWGVTGHRVARSVHGREQGQHALPAA